MTKAFKACSVHIKDLYYSLPHEELLKCVEESIDCIGALQFQNSANVTVDGFLELLEFYLRSTFAEWDGNYYVQKQDVCMGSCLAPVFSNLILAHLDRCLTECLEGYNI